MNGRKIAASMAVVTAAMAVMPITAEASTNIDLRKKVIGISGIMSVSNMDSERRVCQHAGERVFLQKHGEQCEQHFSMCRCAARSCVCGVDQDCGGTGVDDGIFRR